MKRKDLRFSLIKANHLLLGPALLSYSFCFGVKLQAHWFVGVFFKPVYDDADS